MSTFVWRIVVVLTWVAALTAFAAAMLRTHESAAAFGGLPDYPFVISKSVDVTTLSVSEAVVDEG